MTNPARRVFTGPFNTEAEAAEAALGYVRRADDDYVEANRAQFADALHDAGVTPGDYDRQTLEWFGGWEPEAVAVVAGFIRRAYIAGGGRGA